MKILLEAIKFSIRCFMNTEIFREIIDFAIEQEQQAADYYCNMQKFVWDPESISLMKQLESMERNHIGVLKQIRMEDIELPPRFKVENVKKSLKVVAQEYDPGISYEEVLNNAIEREKEALDLYLELAQSVKDQRIKNMFLNLSTEETKHKKVLVNLLMNKQSYNKAGV